MSTTVPEIGLYFCRDGQTVEGPFSVPVVRAMVGRKELPVTTPVSIEGSNTWVAFNELPPEILVALSPSAETALQGCSTVIAIVISIFVFAVIVIFTYSLIKDMR